MFHEPAEEQNQNRSRGQAGRGREGAGFQALAASVLTSGTGKAVCGLEGPGWGVGGGGG